MKAGLLHGDKFVPHFFDDRLPGRSVQLGLKKRIADEICCFASLANALERERLAIVG